MSNFQDVQDIQTLQSGDIIRRISPKSTHQGVFVKHGDGGSMIVADVVDIEECAFVAEGAIMRPTADDKIQKVTSRFKESEKTIPARQLLMNWTLFKEHPEKQKEISEFVENVYSPDQIMDFNKEGNLRALFVPIQQKFKIGKFKEVIDWAKVRDEKFTASLEAMSGGAHMTYVAFIPGEQNHKPIFYTIGTKPHQETITQLNREPFAFKPTHAGHIKATSGPDQKKAFVVDAGSNFLGAGIHTSLPTAEMVTDALHELYPDYTFEAMAGRGAFGLEQSY